MRLIARTQAQLREAANRLAKERIIAVDTETTGLDPYTTVIHSVQLSSEDGTYSVLVPRLDSPSYPGGTPRAPFLGALVTLLAAPTHLKLAQNASFDLKMLMHHYPEFKAVRWFDTMVAERLLTAGLYKRTSLADITERYLGKKRDKEIRTTFYDGTWDGFTWMPDLVDYAMEDVEDLGTIAKQQMAKLRSEGLLEVAQLEMGLLPVWARMELRGITYDREGGQQFADDMRAKADELQLVLQSKLDPFWHTIWMRENAEKEEVWNRWSYEWETIKSETSTKKGKTPEQIEAQKMRRAIHQAAKPKPSERPVPYESLNPGSPLQLLPVLRATGLSLSDTKKETLEELAGANEYIDLLLDWRQYDKLAGTFGAPLLESINAVTCRIHPNFNPVVATGRCSCFNPNLQQIPQRTDQGKRLRKLFVAAPGRKLVVADYSGIELVIIAVMSGDEVLLKAINGNLDLHSYTISHALSTQAVTQELLYMSLVNVKSGKGTQADFSRITIARTTLENIANIPLLSKRGWDEADMLAWVKNLRDIFKTISYGTAYGLSKWGLARRMHFEVDAAQSLIDLFFRTYPKTGAWLKEQGRSGLKNLYSVTALGRKRYYRMPRPVTPDRVDELANKMLAKDTKDGIVSERAWFGDYQRRARQELLKEYNSRLASIERQAGNAPVQGTSADGTKRAMLYVEQEAEARNWDPTEGVLFPVHDELVAEVLEEHAEEMRGIMKTQMERAIIEILGPGVNVVVTPEIVEFWKH